MTAAEFKKKWSCYRGKESSAYQEHFNDLCRLLGQATPAEADPSGSDYFCFQKRVVKDLELLELHETPDAADPTERGFADVWKRDCFGWEYKGRKKNLDDAYTQLLRYREALLNPPLLVVCDFDRYIIRTNFNGTVMEPHEFTNEQIDRPENLRILRACFEDPEFLKPQKTTTQVTEKLAAQIAEVARLLQTRESVELADAHTRAEITVAQKKNLRIARFLNRMVFCFFAEDTGLLPKNLFTDLLKAALHDPLYLTQAMEQLFRVMAKGGLYGPQRIRHFNGHLFEESTVFELTEEEIGRLAEAAEADWQFIQPSIMGNLFERGLDPDHRAQLGAHYTSEADIVTLVEPVLMAPLRRGWAKTKAELAKALREGKGTKAKRERLQSFLKTLSSTTVLDPACGSGNFLYVSLRLLLDLEKEVITFAMQLGFKFEPSVSVHQLKAIEINAYAFELAQVSVQIGYLQWRRDNGFDNDRTPVLQVLEGFENKDALLHETFRKKPKNLKEARRDEHGRPEDLFKVYVERAWPPSEVIVGNPPFLGDKLMRRELGDAYVEQLRQIYGDRIPGQSDLCCYWFEKARDLIEHDKCKRAGLLATQGIRGGANREVLKRINKTGDIFFAISERPWILEGANVTISMAGFDDGSEKEKQLDGVAVAEISAQLTSKADVTQARRLVSNSELSFIGASMHGPFPIDERSARDFLLSPNPTGLPSSDVVRLWCNGLSIVQREHDLWIVDVAPHLTAEEAARYEKPFEYLRRRVLPIREKNRRPMRRKNWWLLGDPQKAMRAAVEPLRRYLATPRVAKHRVFVWMSTPVLPTDQVIAFGREDDYFLGVLQSRVHGTWALRQCTVLGGNTPRYGPSQCFETFPFPFPDDLTPKATPTAEPPLPKPNPVEAEMLAAKYYSGKESPPPYRVAPRTPADHRDAIGAAARELNQLRERWLNPPEWTVEYIMEFPGSFEGPWWGYVGNTNKNEIGTVRYPRLEPRDPSCAAKLKKRTLTNLYNERPTWLDDAHKKLDEAVAAAYGWPADLSDEDILARLLALNLARAAEEAKAEKAKAPRGSRARREDEML